MIAIGTRSHYGRLRSWMLGGAVAGALLGIAATPAAADKTAAEKKRTREIGIMERTLDQVLVDSPHLLVSSRSVTEGIYVDGVGAVFTFTMDVVPRDWGLDGLGFFRSSHYWGHSRVEVEDDGDKIIIYKDDWDEDDEEDEEDEEDKAPKKKKSANVKEESLSKWREKAREYGKKQYADGKAELIDAVIDYGAETLGSLTDAEWVVIAARLPRNRFFLDEGLRQLNIKVRLGDLRAHEAGRLTRDALLGRFQIEES
jgi:hypothetical protein